MHDLVIRAGTVVDGTGAAPRVADVAVEDGRIVAVGRDVGAGRRELDADGLLVTPGWVDIHSHYDGQALWDPILETSAAHGVTTVVMGNCGVGFAPVRRDQQAWTIALMEGVEDIPAAVLEEGLGWEWESFPQYLDALDAAPHAIDIAAQVPHAPLRVFAMGERGIDHEEQPTADEIALMGRVAAQAIEAGAVGFSTSRSKNHRASDGRITPSYSAGEAELLGIAEAIGRTGKGVFELNVENWDIDAELALMRRMCEVSGRPLSAALLQRPGQPADNYRRVLDGLSKAAADGLDMWAQVAARPTGLLMSLRGRVNPLAASPTYQELARLGFDGLQARLADPADPLAHPLRARCGRRRERADPLPRRLRAGRPRALRPFARSDARGPGEGRRGHRQRARLRRAGRRPLHLRTGVELRRWQPARGARDAPARAHRAGPFRRRCALHDGRRLRLSDVPAELLGT